MVLLTVLLSYSAVEIVALGQRGEFVAPREDRCVRLVAGKAQAVRVNGIPAGDTSRADGILDITGFLVQGRPNVIEAAGAKHVLISPRVYLDGAERRKNGTVVAVTVVNTTENTMQVELGASDQFTLSPGTATTREVRHAGSRIRMRATSDGLDLAYEDDIPVL